MERNSRNSSLIAKHARKQQQSGTSDLHERPYADLAPALSANRLVFYGAERWLLNSSS